MRYAALIPARGGSVRIPRKNLASIGGRTLVQRAIDAAYGAGIDDITVSTDSEVIGEHAQMCGAAWLRRPADLSKGEPGPDGGSSTERVVAHWWRSLVTKPDVIVLLQPTSPLRTAGHVSGALSLLTISGADSVMGCVRNPRGHFAGRAYPRETGAMRWTQYRGFGPPGYRPRTQDGRAILEDNGAVYVTRRSAWEISGLRCSGTIAAYVMDEDSSIDIDEPEDLERARDAFARRERKGAA